MARPEAAINQDLDTSFRWYDEENKVPGAYGSAIPFFICVYPRSSADSPSYSLMARNSLTINETVLLPPSDSCVPTSLNPRAR
jgi:hypothetical protein